MNPLLRSSAAHVFVASLDEPELDSDDAHHLVRVLRLRDGEAVTASDGLGGWRPCVLSGGGLQVAGEAVREPQPAPVVIAAAVPKGDRAEWMVQKLTEVGVTRLVLVDCARSVVRWTGERAERQRMRLMRVAREAAMQSRRVWLPSVEGPLPYSEVVRGPGVVVAEPGGAPWSASMATTVRPDTDGAITVVIGPEGGFGPEELALAPALVSLGEHVLRVETAALVAAVRLVHG